MNVDPISELAKVHPGWEHLLMEWKANLQKLGGKDLDAKEKWGGLRLSALGDSRVSWVCRFVEELSFRTCYKCGAFGKLHVKLGYQMTLCSGCAAANGYVEFPSDGNNEAEAKPKTPSRNGFAELPGGWTILAATLSTCVGNAGGVVTKFEVHNGRLRSNWDCNGNEQAKAPVNALVYLANGLSSRICSTCGKPSGNPSGKPSGKFGCSH